MPKTVNINTVIVPQNYLHGFLSGFKHKFPKIKEKAVVNSIPKSNFNSVHVGETCRTLDIRLKEHKHSFKLKNCSPCLRNRSYLGL